VYAGDAYLGDWARTLGAVRALNPRVLVPGRGAVLEDAAAAAEAIDLTHAFLTALIQSVQTGLAAGDDLRGCFERAKSDMEPLFGHWPVFQHVLPFDVSRAFDELHSIEHPVIWTAARDRDLWQALRA
jgi:hypothetical protein